MDRRHPREIAESEGRALDELGVGRIEVDAQGCVRWMNAEAEELTGWPFAQAVGVPAARLLDPDGAPAPADGAFGGVVRLTRRDGRSTATILSRVDRAHGAVLLLRRVAEAAADPGPRRDRLTGLPGRDALLDEARAGADEGTFLAVLEVQVLDLVVAACGYEAGDLLVQWAAARLRELVHDGREAPAQASGSRRSVLVHLTSSCFGILLRRGSTAAAERALRRVQRELASFRFNWDGCSFRVETSVGAAGLRGGAGATLERAMRAARTARERGDPRLVLLPAAEARGGPPRAVLGWVANLEPNLDGGRGALHAQPVRSLRGATGAYVEVLLRIVGDDGEPRPPGAVIAAAERHGRVETLDRWVIDRTLATLGARGPSGLRRIHTCAINLSGASVTSDTLFDFIVDAFGRHGVPPHLVCFEITETAAISDLPTARYLVDQLAALGARVAIDDFGSGVSSFSYLRELHADTVKIDGSVIRRCARDPVDRCIVESVVRIAEQLGASTVAEWVEDDETTRLLENLGVDHVQGFFHGRPAPLEGVLEAWADARPPRRAVSGVQVKVGADPDGAAREG
ncbi:MAG TPA: EAL domain-containing protein [Sandaracinaceae bacterium LLY-WYZ-13_1]|nr:EAL domain-containing protein [Sandaracinaceae bacterium LLY-WYZ-13_1]